MNFLSFITLIFAFTVAYALPLKFQPGADSTRSSISSRQSNSTSNPKYVVAHHMVGNTYPYTVDNWSSDIALAHSAGIDGFALNIGSDPWQQQRVADAYTAAQQFGPDFKLFISFDMSVLPCSSPDNAGALRNYITTYANHPNQLKYDGKVFASTFAGESCAFGQGSVAQGWSSQFTQHPELSGANAVYFAPSFFVDPNTFSTYNGAMDGAFNFNSGWPITLTTSSAQNIVSQLGASLQAISRPVVNALAKFIGSTSTDKQYLNGLSAMASNGGTRAYMAAVSPWFFTHYSPQTYDKNFIYLADSHLYPTRWENLVNMRDQVDLVEIVTWNDYGESHYIGPIEGAQPNSQAWVDGLDHTGWLDMTSYFATAYKTGSYPAITQDKIYLWSRTHPKDADASDPVGKPSNFELTQDTLWAVVMATAPATVTLTTSPSNSQTFNVQAGMNKLSIPISAGDTMKGVLTRDGTDVVTLAPSSDDFSFNGSPDTYNYNAFVAFSQ